MSAQQWHWTRPPGPALGTVQVAAFMPRELCTNTNIFAEELTPPKGAEGWTGFQNLATLQPGDHSTTKVLGVI